MTPEAEIPRLRDLMPASARMRCKLVSRPQQSKVLRYQPALPWGDRPIEINFRLWQHLDTPERDLLLLRAVAWLNTTGLIKLDLYQGLTVAGLLGTVLQVVQADPVGILVAGANHLCWPSSVAKYAGHSRGSSGRSPSPAIGSTARLQ